MEFFEFYGIRFNYKTTGIKFSDQSFFIPKDLFLKNMDRDQHPPLLCIEDPLCPGNNVARRSYSSYKALDAFKHAYLTLSAALRADAENVGTILSSILHIPLVCVFNSPFCGCTRFFITTFFNRLLWTLESV